MLGPHLRLGGLRDDRGRIAEHLMLIAQPGRHALCNFGRDFPTRVGVNRAAAYQVASADFPTRVGVNRTDGSAAMPGRFPHTRGGEPARMASSYAQHQISPHAWG